MDTLARTGEKQTHVVCIPCPAQSHIKAMRKLTKLLYSKGIFITLSSTTNASLNLEHLNLLTAYLVSDLKLSPPSDADSTQDGALLVHSIINNTMLPPFQDLLIKLNAGSLPVTSICSDGFMPHNHLDFLSFWFGHLLPVHLWGFISFVTSLKNESYGHLDTIIYDIPGMRDIRLRNLPSHVQIMHSDDTIFNYITESAQRASNAAGNVLHTFDTLEPELVNVISSMFPNVYTIGPQQLLLNNIPSGQKNSLKGIGYSTCLQWLDSKEANSVVYVNFGSITVMSPEQLVEFGWGLANSNHYFIWIIRPDLIVGESTTTLGLEFMEAIKERGLISSWCPQEDVLNHSAVGGFLTHGGWNSIMESLSSGVPMLCWPFFADQPTNCRYICKEWECGMEIDNDVKRDDVEKLVRVLMDGEKGKRTKEKAMEWKKMAEMACDQDGPSSRNLDKLVQSIIPISNTPSPIFQVTIICVSVGIKLDHL